MGNLNFSSGHSIYISKLGPIHACSKDPVYQSVVLSQEVVLFLEVKNELLRWERGPEVCPLFGYCPFLREYFIGSSTK